LVDALAGKLTVICAARGEATASSKRRYRSIGGSIRGGTAAKSLVS
jgi:hypothetical protein